MTPDEGESNGQEMPNETEAGSTRNLYRGSAIYAEACIIPDIEISAEVKRSSQVAATLSETQQPGCSHVFCTFGHADSW